MTLKNFISLSYHAIPYRTLPYPSQIVCYSSEGKVGEKEEGARGQAKRIGVFEQEARYGWPAVCIARLLDRQENVSDIILFFFLLHHFYQWKPFVRPRPEWALLPMPK